MAKDKKSFIAYCEWIETFDELSDEDAGKLIKHIFRYVNDKDPQTDDKLTKMCFIPIKQSLKRDLMKYDKYILKQKENGAKGGRPKITQITQPLIEKPKKADNVNDSVNVNVSDNVINSLIQRKGQFKELLKPFLGDYGKDVLNNFYEYWTEHEEKGKKMRHELSKNKPFNIKTRLVRCKKRNRSNSKKDDTIDRQDISAPNYLVTPEMLEEYNKKK